MTKVGVLPALSPDGAAAVAAGSALGSDLPLSWLHAATASTGTRIARIEGITVDRVCMRFMDHSLPATGCLDGNVRGPQRPAQVRPCARGGTLASSPVRDWRGRRTGPGGPAQGCRPAAGADRSHTASP